MEKEHHVPTWDGQAKSWRRYTREVCWFVRSTPVHKRKYVANRLMSRLTGPARLLAMSWTHVNFDHGGGTKQYLRLLANSPLVRRSLPNAAAICQQYFSFRRSPGEAMHSFLVRESLGYSEFVEAIIRLYEEKHGVVQREKDFGLPDDPEDDQDTWWNWEDWEETDPGLYRAEERRAEGAQPAAEEERAAQREQAESGSPQGQYQRVDDFIRSQSATPERRSQAVQPSQSPEEVSELSLSDSFVLGVLRGFRLLQAAGLSPEDKRDILGTIHVEVWSLRQSPRPCRLCGMNNSLASIPPITPTWLKTPCLHLLMMIGGEMTILKKMTGHMIRCGLPGMIGPGITMVSTMRMWQRRSSTMLLLQRMMAQP